MLMKNQTQLVPLESSIPTLLFKKDGQVVKQVAGVHTLPTWGYCCGIELKATLPFETGVFS